MTKLLYNFLWLHSLLMWLFTFFLPVLLYKTGFSLTQISLFIALTWWAFVIFLYIWDVIRYKYGIKSLIYISFFLEILLIATGFFLEKNIFILWTLAIIYGAYNCFFWITKRILFVADAHTKEVGNKFGNIQIVAFVLVKVGILIGSFLLEHNHFIWLLFGAIITSLYGVWYFLIQNNLDKKLDDFVTPEVLSIKEVLSFKDDLRSRTIFLLDGPFLFFESFFWLLSLFFIAHHSYSELGIIVIILAVSFSVVFVLIKKQIDKLSVRKLLLWAVALYCISWILRWIIGDTMNMNAQYAMILFIAFFTSFFRLAFNKQFFHTSKQVDTHKYMLIKSYYSQANILIIFGLLSIVFYIFSDVNTIAVWLSVVYYIAAIFSVWYLLYKPLDKSEG